MYRSRTRAQVRDDVIRCQNLHDTVSYPLIGRRDALRVLKTNHQAERLLERTHDAYATARG